MRLNGRICDNSKTNIYFRGRSVMKSDQLLDLAWAIAEMEARALGSEVVEPMHFLLAALKIVDVDFPAQLDKLDMTSDAWKSMCKDAKKVLEYLDVLPEKITEVRRRIRHRLARAGQPTIPKDQLIHRSRKTRAAFYDAASQTDGEVITLLQLMKSMFELGFLDVLDMRWRMPTKTFRKE